MTQTLLWALLCPEELEPCPHQEQNSGAATRWGVLLLELSLGLVFAGNAVRRARERHSSKVGITHRRCQGSGMRFYRISSMSRERRDDSSSYQAPEPQSGNTPPRRWVRKSLPSTGVCHEALQHTRLTKSTFLSRRVSSLCRRPRPWPSFSLLFTTNSVVITSMSCSFDISGAEDTGMVTGQPGPNIWGDFLEVWWRVSHMVTQTNL